MKFWLFWILTFSIGTTAYFSWHRNHVFEPFPMGCDPYGYLQQAQTMRNAWKTGGVPHFDVSSDQTRKLVTALEAAKIPLEKWDEFIAPGAHHYMPLSKRISCQYSPGTAFVLSIWDGPLSVRHLNEIVIFFFAAIGWIGALRLLRRGEIFQSMGWTTLSIASMIIPVMNGLRSFSISALMIPLFLAVFTSIRGYAFMSGFFMGLTGMIRIVQLLWAPAPALMMTWRKWLRYGAGVLLGGLIPLAVYQAQEAGRPWLPTYHGPDTDFQWSAERFAHHLKWYLWDKIDSHWAWIFYTGLTLVIGALVFKDRTSHRSLKWKMFSVAFVFTLINIVYFAGHLYTGHYYLLPSFLMFSWYALFSITRVSVNRVAGYVWALVLVVLPFAEIAGLAGYGPPALKDPMPSVSADIHSTEIPQELLSPDAWIWADDTSGTFWYYGRKTAFKTAFADPETLKWTMNWIRKQPGSKQYVIQDIDSFEQKKKNLTATGGKLVERGKIFGFPYFEITWKK